MALTLYTHLIAAKTANYVAQTSDGVIYANGATQITLFSANGKQGHEVSVKNMGAGDCNVITSNSELIDANNSWNLVQYGTLTIVSDGVKWTRLPVGGGGGLSNSDATTLNGKTEAQLNVNSALFANQSNSATYANTAGSANTANTASTANNATYAFGKSEGDLNVNNALTANQANSSLYANTANAAGTANNATYAFGKSEGDLNVNSALSANVANNATYAFGKSEAGLNVNSALASNTANSALSANNSSYLNGHTEGQLNANSALTANNSGYLNGHTEAQLNANSALSANNAAYLTGHTEAQLNVNNALTANQANSALHANNSGYLNTHTESQLNVNSALTANNSTYAFGKSEGNLNVNSALTANVANTANDASYLGGQLPAYYTNASNANTGTLPDARLSANVVRYETSQTQNYVLAAPAGANGNITFRALTSNDVTNLDERIQDMNIYGFAELGDVETNIAFEANTYTFTLANTSAATWHFFVQGTWYAASGPRTVTLPGTPPANGVYFIYIDGSTGAAANLVANTIAWTLSENDGILPVAVVRWSSDANSSPRYFMADERHTCAMSRTLHRYLHTTRGAQFISGGGLTGQTFNSSTNSALTFAVANTIIMDEDLTHTIPGLADGTGEANAYIVAYRSNTTNWYWRQSEVPFLYTANSYIQWDSNGTMTTGTTANFYTSYILATSFYLGPGGNTGILVIPGRGEHLTQAAAEAENPALFDWTGLSIAEGLIIWRIVWESKNNYGTRGLVQMKSIQRVTVAVSTAVVGAAVTDHNALTGLQGGNAGEYYHITAAQWANGSLTANVANTANSATYPAGLVAVKGDLIIGNATPAWSKLAAGANGYVLTINDNVVTWNEAVAGVSTHTLLQSNVHTDTTNGTVTRGDVIVAQGASPTWARLAIGANTYVLTSNGTEAVWAAPSANVVTENANNAYYLNGKAEAALNVNFAMTANNATYAFGKTEGSLNVNSALSANTANNADFLDGAHQADLNVNSALSSNNTSYLSGHTEGQLNVNSALNANNSAYLDGHTEGQLNVNSALTANSANSTPFASNADMLDGQHGSFYTNATNINTGTLPAAQLSGGYGNVTHIGVVDELYFNTSPANATIGVGKLVWSNTDLTLDLGLNSNTTLQIGQETLIKVVNKTGNLVGDGNAVYISGAQGNRPKINLVLANNHTTATTLGLVTGDIANNEEGFVTVRGLVRGIDTTGGAEAWANGDALYTSKTTPGALTNIEPVAPHHQDRVGFVIHAHGTQGMILVNVHPHNMLLGPEHGDIDGPPSANNQVPVWNTAQQFFTFKIPPEALNANNATYAFGKSEGDLNANSALTANNATYAYGKTEGNLNVNSALVANNATNAYGKTEANLNVNSAVTANQANNASYLSTHTEAQLNVNSAVTANNSTYAFGKSEGDLNANSALTANNSTYAYGKTEGNLNVNSALYANNSGYLNGHAESALSVNVAVTANTSNTANSALYANDTTHLRTFDVSANTPANAQVLTFSTDSNTWYAATPTGGPGGPTAAEDLTGTMINSNVTNSSLQTLGTLVALQVNTMLYVNSTNVGIGTAPNGALEVLASSIIMGVNNRNDLIHANTTIGFYLKGSGKGIGFQPKASYNTALWIANTGEIRIAQTGIWFYNYEDLEAAFAANNSLPVNGVINAFTYTGTSNNALYLGGTIPATGSILIGNTSNGWSGLAIGANTYVLTSNGTTASWQAPAAGPGGGGGFTNDGNSGANASINWANTTHYITLTANCTFAFTGQSDGGRYMLMVNSGAGQFQIIWPANVKWGPGGQPLNTLVASKVDMFTSIYIATTNTYYMSYALNY